MRSMSGARRTSRGMLEVGCITAGKSEKHRAERVFLQADGPSLVSQEGAARVMRPQERSQEQARSQ